MNSKAFYLRHKQSGLFVHPEGGRVCTNGQPLILYPGGFGETRLLFQWNAGCLQHVESGYYVHPEGGHANCDNGRLVFYNAGPEDRLNLRWEGQALKSVESGRYVHPLGGTGSQGAALVFYTGNGGDRIGLEEVHFPVH